MAKLFTEAELEELRRADAEIEEGFTLTQEDLNFSRNLDREAKLDNRYCGGLLIRSPMEFGV